MPAQLDDDQIRKTIICLTFLTKLARARSDSGEIMFTENQVGQELRQNVAAIMGHK